MSSSQVLIHVLWWCSLVLASPTNQTLDNWDLFGRAVGDSCTAPEGTGSCQSTSECNGISYPTGLCPNDPADIQCCVDIQCSTSSGSGYCRSVSNNGCSGGTFVSGACPGDGGIVCCVKSATSPEPEPELDSTDAWPSCKTTLSCSFEAIASVTMSDRRTYVRTMQSYFFDTLNAGDQVRNVEGVITFFIDNDLGAPESWISYVDAGIVQGIQNGGAIALGMSAGTGGNPGSLYWADFFRGMRDGKLGDRDDHDLAWSRAEQNATEYGEDRADSKFTRSGQEFNWFLTTQAYRWIMRNRALTRKIINLLALRFQGIANLADDRIDWLTDVTNPKPGECMSQLGWDFAGALDPNFFNALDGEISWEDLKESILDLPDVAEFFYTLIMLGYNCPRW